MKTLLFTTLFFLAILSATGQELPKCSDLGLKDAFLDQLIGQWRGTGQIGSDKIGYDVEAKWGLQHQFVCLIMKDTSANTQYEANVYIGYDCISERYVGHWLDNFGARYSETLGYGTKSNQSISFRFEYPDGPFINKFEYHPMTNTWSLFSTTKNNKGEWVTFGDITLFKK